MTKEERYTYSKVANNAKKDKGKYINKVWIDTRDNTMWVVYDSYKKGKLTKYWIYQKRPNGKKILKRWCEFESTLTRLKNFLKEVKCK